MEGDGKQLGARPKQQQQKKKCAAALLIWSCPMEWEISERCKLFYLWFFFHLSPIVLPPVVCPMKYLLGCAAQHYTQLLANYFAAFYGAWFPCATTLAVANIASIILPVCDIIQILIYNNI